MGASLDLPASHGDATGKGNEEERFGASSTCASSTKLRIPAQPGVATEASSAPAGATLRNSCAVNSPSGVSATLLRRVTPPGPQGGAFRAHLLHRALSLQVRFAFTAGRVHPRSDGTDLPVAGAVSVRAAWRRNDQRDDAETVRARRRRRERRRETMGNGEERRSARRRREGTRRKGVRTSSGSGRSTETLARRSSNFVTAPPGGGASGGAGESRQAKPYEIASCAS